MTCKRLTFAAVAATVVALAGFALFGCSDDDDDVTNPTPTGFNSGTLNAGASYSRSFPTAATIGYHCIFHRSMGMTGTVTVAGGGADSAVVTASGMVFTPSTVTIAPGGSVRWVMSNGPHTVTQD